MIELKSYVRRKGAEKGVRTDGAFCARRTHVLATLPLFYPMLLPVLVMDCP